MRRNALSATAPLRRVLRKSSVSIATKRYGPTSYRDEGLHGISKAIKGVECKHCHTEHKGRDADIVRFDKEVFDHKDTDFNLKDGHAKDTLRGLP